MKIFYSSPTTQNQYLEEFDIKNLLISIHDIKDLPKVFRKFPWMADGTRFIMIDNGAFSAWNSGHEIITIEKYTEFCNDFYRNFSDKFMDIYFIGLDHIPGQRNVKPTPTQIDHACEVTMSNFQYMSKHGVKNVLPVIHQYEDPIWVKKYEEYTDFLCLSPANDASNKSRGEWLKSVYSTMNHDTKTHGLAVTGVNLQKQFPWYSADSISWKKPFIFGRCFHWDFFTLKEKRFPEFSDYRKLTLRQIELYLSYFDDTIDNKDKARYHMHYHMENYGLLEKYITDLWEKRGVVWKELP